MDSRNVASFRGFCPPDPTDQGLSKFKVHLHFFYVAPISTMTSNMSPQLGNPTCYCGCIVWTAAQQRWPFPLWIPAKAGTHILAPRAIEGWVGLLLQLTGVEHATLRLQSQRLRPIVHHNPHKDEIVPRAHPFHLEGMTDLLPDRGYSNQLTTRAGWKMELAFILTFA